MVRDSERPGIGNESRLKNSEAKVFCGIIPKSGLGLWNYQYENYHLRILVRQSLPFK